MQTSLVVSGACAIMLAVAGGVVTEIGPWYRSLRKPRWQPPDWLFGPAWTLILGMAAWSASLGWDNAGSEGRRSVVLGLFIANAILHFVWSPLFFKFRRPDWALAEVGFLWLSIVVPIIYLAPISALASWLLIPYLVWVTFASRLNLEIVRMNKPFTGRRPHASPLSGRHG
jgi:translocator protein